MEETLIIVLAIILVVLLRLAIGGPCSIGLHHWNHPGGHCVMCGKVDRSLDRERRRW
jgi:hypothetical protein